MLYMPQAPAQLPRVAILYLLYYMYSMRFRALCLPVCMCVENSASKAAELSAENCVVYVCSLVVGLCVCFVCADLEHSRAVNYTACARRYVDNMRDDIGEGIKCVVLVVLSSLREVRVCGKRADFVGVLYYSIVESKATNRIVHKSQTVRAVHARGERRARRTRARCNPIISHKI